MSNVNSDNDQRNNQNHRFEAEDGVNNPIISKGRKFQINPWIDLIKLKPMYT